MKKKIKIISFLSLFLICLFGIHCSVFAATTKATVTKVDSKRYYYSANGNAYQYHIIYGKTKEGKTVWKYKTSKCMATELDSAGWKMRGSYVYLIDNTTFLRLNKQTGKVEVKKKIKSSSFVGWSPVMYVNASGNVYCMGYYGSRVVKFSKNGTVQWTRTISSKYYWPYMITSSGGKLSVYFDGSGSGKKVLLDTKTGKILSYK